MNDMEASYPNVDGNSESAPDSRGLSTRSLSLRLRADRSLFVSKGSSAIVDSNGLLKLRCVSAMPAWLPGGPHRRQFTITAKLRLDAHNGKLGLLGSAGTTSCGCPGALLMVAALMFLKSAFQQRPRILY
ncbi:uncharacterized protein LOC143911224 [Arctopsyche grandis]|uniref:uncharacterized protein LOC143911224 n=1 Tax=Arctopsyche grandis TaxID=121162 RepID=UPI00406D6558